MRQFALLIALTPFALIAHAESPLILGARGGAPFTSDGFLTSSLGLSSHPFVIGPTAGVRLPLGFSVEGDALYKHESVGLASLGGFGGLGTSANSWQFPVMLKFTPGHSFLAPVLGAGVSFRHMNNIEAQVLSESVTQNSIGLVAGAGLRFKAGPVNITPELRYTHWSSGNGNNIAQGLLNTLAPANNEAQVLIGLTF